MSLQLWQVGGRGCIITWEPCDCNLRKALPTRARHFDASGLGVCGRRWLQPWGPPGKGERSVGSEPIAEFVLRMCIGLGLLALGMLLLQLREADKTREEQF